jgi:catecholate siderophore receptor
MLCQVYDIENTCVLAMTFYFGEALVSAQQKQKRMKAAKMATWPVAYRLAAIGSLVVYTAIGSKTYALPQSDGVAGGVATPTKNLVTERFDISAGPLESVLAAFEAKTGWKITLQREGLAGLPSRGVSGLYTVEQAIRQILTGTGVSHRVTGQRTMTLDLRDTGSSVEVVDSATAVSSPKYTGPLRDIPQTITLIPRSVMEQQSATTLRDVLRNVPGLTVVAGEGGAPAGDNLTLRGFSARNDMFVDGVRDISPQARDPFNMEQVEVVKGPSSAFAGRGSAGGTINMVSKGPSLNRYVGATLNLGSDDTRRLAADINTPLTKLGLGERSAFRLNMLGHKSGVAGRDVVKSERWGMAPSLVFGLGTPTRATFSYYKLKQDNISDYGIPWVPATNNALAEYRDQPAPVPRETFYGFKNRDYERMNTDQATFRVEHDFSDNLHLRNQLRYARSTRDSMATPPRFAGNDSTAINREMRSFITKDTIWDNQTDLTANFRTGGIEHSVVAGSNFSNEGNIRHTRTGVNSLTTLLNPNADDVYTGLITLSPLVGDVTGKTAAVYAFDTIKFGPKWMFNGGLRWDRFAVDGVSTTLAPVVRTDKMTSGRAALTYKPVQNGSIYASWGSSLSPSLEGLSYVTSNTAIAPEKTQTYEIGNKWDFIQGRLLLTGALFRVDKLNARTPGVLPDDPPQILAGKQRVQGVELGLSGSITRAWTILAGYTNLNGKIRNSTTPAEVGKEIQNAPKHSLNLWTTYTYKKLMIGGGPRFLGRRYGNNTNTRSVDSYWTVDALGSYSINRHLDLRLNIYNLNNAYYFDRLGGGHVVPGASRSVMVSTAFRF